MSNYTGFEPQDHSTLQIQGRVAGMFPGEWKVVWATTAELSASRPFANAVLREYRDGKRHSPVFYNTASPLEFRLVRITVRQTVTVDVLSEDVTA